MENNKNQSKRNRKTPSKFGNYYEFEEFANEEEEEEAHDAEDDDSDEDPSWVCFFLFILPLKLR